MDAVIAVPFGAYCNWGRLARAPPRESAELRRMGTCRRRAQNRCRII